MRSDITQPSPEEMRAYWHNTLAPKLRLKKPGLWDWFDLAEPLSENQRKVVMSASIGFAVAVVYAVQSGSPGTFLTFLIVPFAMLFVVFGGRLPRTKWQAQQKQAVCEAAAEAWGLTYQPSVPNDVPLYDEPDGWSGTFQTFLDEGLLPTFSSEKREDYISGTRRGTRFESFELDLKMRAKNSDRTVFRGLVLRLDWPTSDHGGKVLFVPRKTLLMGKLKSSNGLKRYKPTDPELDKRFGFFVDDPVLGLTALSPSRLARIEDTAAKHNFIRMRGMVQHGSLFLALEMRDMFEDGAKPDASTDPKAFYSALHDMMFICELVDALSDRKLS